MGMQKEPGGIDDGYSMSGRLNRLTDAIHSRVDKRHPQDSLALRRP